MSPPSLGKKWLTNLREMVRRPFSAEQISEPPTDFSGYRYGLVFRRAWSLFLKLSARERWQVAGVFGLLMGVGFVSEQITWESSWKESGIWFLNLSISTWLLALLMLPRELRARWRSNLPGIVLYLFLVDMICQLLGFLIFSGAAMAGILSGWMLPWLPVPPLLGKFSPDFLILGPPLILIGIGGIYVLRTLLGLSLVIPLMLDCNAGVGPAVRASLASTRNHRARLFMLFLLMAALMAFVLIPVSIVKFVILGMPWLFPTLLPASSTGVWICFGLQTVALIGGTFLVIWIWPLGSALWAALYLERWKPAPRRSD
ncbi:MAG: hypothetical protein EB090_01305 [Verrucomicrobia bacterium]|nr:hypothetical protein [Verrucomicrobiota bacterium]